MELDALLLARIQFAFTVSFHILFPAFTIGLASWIAVLEGRWLWTGNDLYRKLSVFWTKIFAVSFGMGVVSGIVMSYQFGTNWSRFSDAGGYVLGPLIQYEVVTAFFLEATFLGIMLFGRGRVPPWMHFFACLMVAVGTLISAFWILSANSFMQTPAGFRIGDDGLLYPESWWNIVFNPSFPYRLTHMIIACFLTTSFVIAGVSAWHLLYNRHEVYARIGLNMSLGLIFVLAPLQIVVGDLHGLNTLEHQPTKIAAMEGNWERRGSVPLILFAIPDQQAEMNRYEIAIPNLASLILTHTWDGEVPGLKEVPPEDRPPVWIVFWSFRIMVGLGLVMLGVALSGAYLMWKRRHYTTRWFLQTLRVCTPIGFVAILMGWTTTEVGRQPWTVYGILRTADSVTPAITGPGVLTSLIVFFVVYSVVFSAGMYYLMRLFDRGPEAHLPPPDRSAPRPKRPFSAADEALEVPNPGRDPRQPAPAE